MGSRLVRFIYDHRAWLKPLVFVRRPVPVPLEGFTLFVRLDDWAVGARIAVRRRYEPHLTTLLRHTLAPGAVMVDVGANIGYHSLLAASRVGARGRVIAFEPSRENCALLRRSLDANGFENVVIHNRAVADVDGVVGYGMDDSNGRIELTDPSASPFQVPAVRLDTALAEEPRVDVIKIDIEGAEGRALRGMREVIDRHRPIVLSEFTPTALPEASGMSAEEYLNLLREPGYELFVIHRDRAPDTTPQSNAEILRVLERTPRLEYLDLMARPRG